MSKWTNAEHDRFSTSAKKVVAAVVAKAGSKCGQVLHDGGTLANGRKFQAIGLQFVAPDWSQNMILCLGFPEQETDGSATKIAKLIEDVVLKITGYTAQFLLRASIQDGVRYLRL